MIDIAQSQLVHGIQEKVYRLAQAPHLSEDDAQDVEAEDHFRYFTTYVLTLLRDFADYLRLAQDGEGRVDAAADHAGYTEARFYASEEELRRLEEALNEALLPLMENKAGGKRKRHKVAIVAQPVRGKPQANEAQEGNDE
jgi:hypothetical protein